MAEQLTLNQLVPGSSPGRGTNFMLSLARACLLVAAAGSLELPDSFDAAVRDLYDREIRSSVHHRW